MFVKRSEIRDGPLYGNKITVSEEVYTDPRNNALYEEAGRSRYRILGTNHWTFQGEMCDTPRGPMRLYLATLCDEMAELISTDLMNKRFHANYSFTYKEQTDTELLFNIVELIRYNVSGSRRKCFKAEWIRHSQNSDTLLLRLEFHGAEESEQRREHKEHQLDERFREMEEWVERHVR